MNVLFNTEIDYPKETHTQHTESCRDAWNMIPEGWGMELGKLSRKEDPSWLMGILSCPDLVLVEVKVFPWGNPLQAPYYIARKDGRSVSENSPT